MPVSASLRWGHEVRASIGSVILLGAAALFTEDARCSLGVCGLLASCLSCGPRISATRSGLLYAYFCLSWWALCHHIFGDACFCVLGPHQFGFLIQFQPGCVWSRNHTLGYKLLWFSLRLAATCFSALSACSTWGTSPASTASLCSVPNATQQLHRKEELSPGLLLLRFLFALCPFLATCLSVGDIFHGFRWDLRDSFFVQTGFAVVRVGEALCIAAERLSGIPCLVSSLRLIYYEQERGLRRTDGAR